MIIFYDHAIFMLTFFNHMIYNIDYIDFMILFYDHIPWSYDPYDHILQAYDLYDPILVPPSIVDTRSSTDLVVREKEKVIFQSDDNLCKILTFSSFVSSWAKLIVWQQFPALDNFRKPLSMFQFLANLTYKARFDILNQHFKIQIQILN